MMNIVSVESDSNIDRIIIDGELFLIYYNATDIKVIIDDNIIEIIIDIDDLRIIIDKNFIKMIINNDIPYDEI